MSSKVWVWKVSENLEKLSKRIRPMLEAQIRIEEKTIVINGQTHTVKVKVCPAVHGTGSMGRPIHYMKGEFNYSKKGNKVR